jgi:hypothetical protein
MVLHFFYDITHFDTNFFITVKDLLFKPGFLSKEYIKGKRASYLHPVRMYVFTSAIFFLIFFSFLKPTVVNSSLDKPMSLTERQKFIKEREIELKKDPSKIELIPQIELLKDTSKAVTQEEIARFSTDDLVTTGHHYRNVEEYDSVQKTLPKKERDGWISRRYHRKAIEFNNKYRGQPKEALNHFTESILHKLPYLLFVSLPLFALLLKLVYVRRKQFFYSDHGIFTIHLYIFTFLLLMLIFISDSLYNATGWTIFNNVLIPLLFIILFLYLLLAMKNFYGQRWPKTILKYIIVATLSVMMMGVLLVAFIFFTAFTL